MEVVNKMKSAKTLLSVGALAGIIAFGAFAGAANAAAPRQLQTPGTGTTAPVAPDRPIRIMGRVASVGSDSLTLNVRNGMTATVRVNDNTWILVPQNGSCAQ